MKTGLVSVTFRQLEAKKIIELAKLAGLDGIEWGSDVHCPITDKEKAREIAGLMQENSLETISYGSYYKLSADGSFDDILEIAMLLNAPNIRVWAGSINAEDCNEDYFNACVADAKAIAARAACHNITISFEYHGNSLTNTQSAAVKLLKAIDMENVFSYWQPLANTTYEQNLDNINEFKALNKLKNIHMFHWVNGDRLPLIKGEKLWQEYLKLASDKANAVLLEFVKDDSVEQFVEDAKILTKLAHTV